MVSKTANPSIETPQIDLSTLGVSLFNEAMQHIVDAAPWVTPPAHHRVFLPCLNPFFCIASKCASYISIISDRYQPLVKASLIRPTLLPPTKRMARRERVSQWMLAQGGGIAVVPTGSLRMRNADTSYPFRFDSHFYYLTGFTEPDAWLAIIARDGQPTQSWLLCQPKNPESETWDGKRWGPDAAKEAFGLDGAFSVDEIDTFGWRSS